jgi:hypothetical protein
MAKRKDVIGSPIDWPKRYQDPCEERHCNKCGGRIRISLSALVAAGGDPRFWCFSCGRNHYQINPVPIELPEAQAAEIREALGVNVSRDILVAVMTKWLQRRPS